METAVTKLETLFQKAESDLDYIQHRVEFEIMKSLPDDTSAEENPAALLKELPLLKSRYKSLCEQMRGISMEQKESMDGIRAALQRTAEIVLALQEHTGLESSPLSAEEEAAAQLLDLEISGTEMDSSVEESSCEESPVPDSPEEPQFTPLTEETLMSVPRSIRSTVKLADLNCLYKELFDHFVVQNNRAALSLSQMKKMDMKVTDSRIQILKELGIVELDKQGNVKLAV